MTQYIDQFHYTTQFTQLCYQHTLIRQYNVLVSKSVYFYNVVGAGNPNHGCDNISSANHSTSTKIITETNDVEYNNHKYLTCLGALNLSFDLQKRVYNFIPACKLMRQVYAEFFLTFLKLIVN